MKSENKNFLYNVVYQGLLYLFPLVTIPYTSRVLEATNIGIYSYTYSIVSLFMLIGMLGINNYGNRSISKVRDDKEQLSYTFCSIYYLQLMIMALICGAYLLYLLFFCKEYQTFFWIQFLHLISVCFDINWFYFGLEQFKLTIRRNLFIKIFSIILIFLFVKTADDLWIYTLIMASSVLLSQLYLILKFRKFSYFQKVKFADILKHLKGCLVLFIPVLAYSIYRVMDKTMIGSISSVTELGYYENAERIINIPIAVITALGTVMLPRMSYLLKDDQADYKGPIYDSMKLALLLSVTMALGLVLVGQDAALILFGESFVKSGTIIQILAVTIVISAWANVVRTQYLIPKGKDRIYVVSTIGGAVINLIFNLIFIRLYGAFGACIGTVLAEAFVMIYQTIWTRKELEFGKYFKLFIEYFGKGILMISIAYLCTFYLSNCYLRFSLQIIISVFIFFLLYYKYIWFEFLGHKKKKR